MNYDQLLWKMFGSGNETEYSALLELFTDASGLSPLIGANIGLPAAWEPVTARPTANQILTQNSTTLQNITGCAAAVTAGWVYDLELTGIHRSAAAADIRYGWSTTATGTTMDWGLVAGTLRGINDVQAADGIDVSTSSIVRMVGKVYCPTTSGVLQLRAAQNTGDLSNTTVMDETEVVLRPLRRLT
jgi:hypothetical protein